MTVVTVREAASRLGVGYSTLKQWIYDGSVRTTRTRGGHHRVPVSEVDRLLADKSRLPDHRRRAPRQRPPSTVIAVSVRNQLRGVIEEVRSDGVLAQVRLRIGDDVITSVITHDAVEALGLKRGRPAIALIKSTEVIIGCEPEIAAARGRRRAR